MLFPPTEEKPQQTGNLRLRQTLRYMPDLNQHLTAVPWVVFDFETTGLKAAKHEIVEIGAIKYVGNKKRDQYSQLINPENGVTLGNDPCHRLDGRRIYKASHVSVMSLMIF